MVRAVRDHHGAVRREAFAIIVRRLEDDLRARFPMITIDVEENYENGLICVVSDNGTLWGTVNAAWIAEGDDVPARAAELALVAIAQDVADNLWPDELTDAWPVCPQHETHPLQSGIARGKASWACSRHDDVAVPIGMLNTGGLAAHLPPG